MVDRELLEQARVALGLMLSYHGQGSADYADTAQVRAQEAYDAIEDALASPPVAVQEERDAWRDIATAPKDGTKYLATDGAAVRVENEPPKHYPGEWDWNAARKQWRGHAHTDLFEATHWMPLLPPPSAMKGDQP